MAVLPPPRLAGVRGGNVKITSSKRLGGGNDGQPIRTLDLGVLAAVMKFQNFGQAKKLDN